ncbi:MAG: antitoxin VbhA family protein [Clostridia bacterium]|nr:antitoxin VbhA family protein [Clostridia bacterium]
MKNFYNKNEFNEISISNVIATMALEGLDIDEESVEYMKLRKDGKVTIEERVAQILERFKQ